MVVYTGELFYRYVNFRYASELDPETERPLGNGRAALRLETFRVIRHTEKGTWIDNGTSYAKFILKGARKKFAHPTIEEAKTSFIARKLRQKEILSAQLRNVVEVLRIAEKDAFPQREGPYEVAVLFELP